jgi:hypothetical protein
MSTDLTTESSIYLAIIMAFLFCEIEEEEINAALKRMLILLDQLNDLSKSVK